MPKLVKGYHTDEEGVVTETDMYQGDLNAAVRDFPKEWSKTGKSSAAKAVMKVAKKARKAAKKIGKSATSPFSQPASPQSGAEDDQ